MELRTNQKIDLRDGGSAAVVRELGRGGQGIVYLVEVNGKRMALKWYLKPLTEAFSRNLEYNAFHGAPSDAFLWPEHLTVKDEEGCCGYIMRLRPEGYYEFGNFLLAKVRFGSFRAMLSAAMKICEGFRMLHLSGFSYQDLNDGNFFINPDTGDVLICDNDNVCAQGQTTGILGKARYMAPEVVTGGTPDKLSDRFSLSVMLFLLFFGSHPFEGKWVAGCPCMTEEFEKKCYGTDLVFIYDRDDPKNRPVKGIHSNVILLWPAFPRVLKDAFVEEFSQERLRNPHSRMLESKWQDVIARARDEIVTCPHCGGETFADPAEGTVRCVECSDEIDIRNTLALAGGRNIPLLPGSQVFLDRDDRPEAEAAEEGGHLWLHNISDNAWTAIDTQGRKKSVAPGGRMPVKAGIKAEFPAGGAVYKGEIRNR